MADEVDPKIRKTITLTHRQAAATGVSITTIFTVLHFLSANYASKADVKALTDQVVEVKSIAKEGFKAQIEAQAAHVADETTKHQRIVDNYRKEISDERDERIREDDSVVKRIDLVMELFKIKHTKTN